MSWVLWLMVAVSITCWAFFNVGYDLGEAHAREAAGLCTRDSGWMGAHPQLERC